MVRPIVIIRGACYGDSAARNNVEKLEKITKGSKLGKTASTLGVSTGQRRPCYAVLFTSVRNDNDPEGYSKMASLMESLAAEQPGYLGIESFRNETGEGITISYWENLESLRAWGRNIQHLAAQELGRTRWYNKFSLRICRIEEERFFQREEET